jgi:hypothetical protein
MSRAIEIKREKEQDRYIKYLRYKVSTSSGGGSATIQTLSGLAPIWDFTLGDWAIIDSPTGNVNLTTSNVATPGAGILHFIQDGAGNRTLTINGTSVSVDPTGNSITRVEVSFDGNDYVYGSTYSAGGASSGELTEYTGISAPSAPTSGVTLFSSKKASNVPAFIDPNSNIIELQQNIFGAAVFGFRAAVGTNTFPTWGGGTFTSVGNVASAPFSGSNYWTQALKNVITTPATLGNSALLRHSSGGCFRTWGFTYSITFGIHVLGTTPRMFVGLTGISAIGNVEPSTVTNMIGVGFDTGETTFRLMHNDGSGTATKVDLGANFPVTQAANIYELRLHCLPAGNVFYSLHRKNTGDIAIGEITTDLPAGATNLGIQIWMNNGATAEAIGFGLCHGVLITPA